MKKNLSEALKNIDMMYDDLIPIANDIIDSYTSEINSVINNMYSKIESLSNDDIRMLMLRISLLSFTFSDVKEKAALKAECAEALKKEAYAIKFNEVDGSNAVKDNTALIEVSNEIVVNAIHDLVSSLFKTKLDELHRIVDTLKSILMSRMQEAKMTFNTSIGAVGEKPFITE